MYCTSKQQGNILQALLTYVACTEYSVPHCHTSTDSLSPRHTLPTPFQRPSADYSQLHSDNVGNFLWRPACCQIHSRWRGGIKLVGVPVRQATSESTISPIQGLWIWLQHSHWPPPSSMLWALCYELLGYCKPRTVDHSILQKCLVF
jgi:hypothetical protein